MEYRVSYGKDRGFNLGPIGFLLIINILLWVATSIKPGLFISLFGLSQITFPEHWWAIATSMFIHDPFPSIWHILANMFTLYFFGSYLTRLVRDKNFLIVYFIGGIIGGIAYLLLSEPFTIAIGASGAVFSVAGALTVLRPKLKVFIIPIPIPIPLWVAVIGGFGLLSIPLFSSGVAWQAHLGGLAFGLIMGYFFRRRQRRILFDF
ncbi:rhomboid family intramembrane serine protease [Chloroflexota bacterium]